MKLCGVEYHPLEARGCFRSGGLWFFLASGYVPTSTFFTPLVDMCPAYLSTNPLLNKQHKGVVYFFFVPFCSYVRIYIVFDL